MKLEKYCVILNVFLSPEVRLENRQLRFFQMHVRIRSGSQEDEEDAKKEEEIGVTVG